MGETPVISMPDFNTQEEENQVNKAIVRDKGIAKGERMDSKRAVPNLARKLGEVRETTEVFVH